MAASDVLKSTDFIEDGAFEPTIHDLEKVVELTGKVELGLKNAFRGVGKELRILNPEDVESAEQVVELLKRVDELEKQLIETKKRKLSGEEKLKQLRSQEAKDQAKINEQIRQQVALNKENAREQLKLIGGYQKASKLLTELRNSYKDLAIAGRENGVVGRGLLQSITEQDERLKRLDATLGQHQRNVGNYTGGILTATKGLSGFAGLIARVGGLLGFNTEALAHSAHAAKELTKVAKDLSKTSKLSTLATQENTTATVVNTEATEGSTVAQTLFATVVGKSTGAMKALRIALAASGIGAILFILYEAASAMGFFSDEVTETTDNTDDLADSVTNLRNALDDLAVNELKNTAKILAAKLAASGKSIDLTKKLSDAEKAVINEQLKNNEKKIQENIVQQEKLYGKLGQIVTNQIDTTKSSYAVFTSEQTTSQKNIQENLTKEQEEQLQIQLNDSKSQNVQLIQEQKNLQTELIINDINFGKDISDIRKENFEKEKKRMEDELEFRKKMEEDYFAHIQKILKDVEEEELKELERRKKQREENFENQKKEDAERMEKRQKEIADAEKERFENDKKRVQEQLELEKMLQDSILKGFEERIEKQKNALDQQISDIDANIQQQRELAARGLDNTLAFEEKRKAESLAKKAELDKKAARLKEASDLAEIFMEYVKAEIQNGSTSANARAFALTFITKGITKAIAGSAYEGVEDTGPAGDGDNKGGKLWMLHPHEGVVTREGNETYPGLVGAVNEGKAFDWFAMQRDDMMNPVLADISRKKQVDSVLVTVLQEEMKGLKKVVKESGDKINWDEHDNMVINRVRNGIHQEIHKKKRFC